MSKIRKILTACLIVAVVSLIIQIIIAVSNPETISVPLFVCIGILPVVLLVARLALKKDEK